MEMRITFWHCPPRLVFASLDDSEAWLALHPGGNCHSPSTPSPNSEHTLGAVTTLEVFHVWSAFSKQGKEVQWENASLQIDGQVWVRVCIQAYMNLTSKKDKKNDFFFLIGNRRTFGSQMKPSICQITLEENSYLFTWEVKVVASSCRLLRPAPGDFRSSWQHGRLFHAMHLVWWLWTSKKQCLG